MQENAQPRASDGRAGGLGTHYAARSVPENDRVRTGEIAAINRTSGVAPVALREAGQPVGRRTPAEKPSRCHLRSPRIRGRSRAQQKLRKKRELSRRAQNTLPEAVGRPICDDQLQAGRGDRIVVEINLNAGPALERDFCRGGRSGRGNRTSGAERPVAAGHSGGLRLFRSRIGAGLVRATRHPMRCHRSAPTQPDIVAAGRVCRLWRNEQPGQHHKGGGPQPSERDLRFEPGHQVACDGRRTGNPSPK